jgi:hypothetical protein
MAIFDLTVCVVLADGSQAVIGFAGKLPLAME